MTKNQKAQSKALYHDTPENRATILDICADSMGLTRHQMLSKCREREYSLARSVAAKIFRDRMHLNLKTIGAVLGPPDAPKHHASVLHMLDLVDQLLWVKDSQMCNLWDSVIYRLSKAMTHGTRVIVYIPDGDGGQLLKYLTDQDYRHEVIE